MRDEDLDKLFRNSLENLDGVPPQAPNWDPDHTFDKIASQLHATGGRKYPGLFDLAAASVVLFLALGYLLSTERTWLLSETDPLQHSDVEIVHLTAFEDRGLINSFFNRLYEMAENTLQEPPYAGRNLAHAAAEAVLETAEHTSQQAAASTIAETGATVALEKKPATLAAATAPQASLALQDQQDTDRHTKGLQFRMPIGAALMGEHFAPTAGIRATATLPSNRPMATTLSAGLSSYFSMEQEGDQKMQINPRFFAEASIGRHTNEKGRTFSGHEIGLGYLINNDGERFQQTTIKLNYSIFVKDRVQVSPEIIVTDNFTRTYPGIRVSLI